MELGTVGGLVTALVSAYDDGLECYTRWQRNKWKANHYQGHTRGRLSGNSSSSCGLNTSLIISGSRLRQVYDGGVDVLGDAFSTGDEQCRGALLASLELLQSQVEALHAAARRDSGPLGLLEVIRASEAVRISTLRALAEQYQRVAVDRLVPRELPIRQPPSRRPSALHKSIEAVGGDDSSPEMLGYGNRAEEMNGSDSGADDTGDAARGNGKEDEGTGGDKNHDEDVSVHLTASHNTAGSSKSPFQSEPPSPPQTPKIVPDDLQSTCTSELGPRPRASVFSVFCPEAMEYQVDLRKAMPSPSSASRPGKKQKTCCSRCGYRWDGTGNGGCAGRRDSTFMSSMSNNKPATATSIAIKHGFQLTPRFLGKSHCQSGGFGCVLCTSSGATGVYDTVESLRDHINTSHDKWQMLHERDLASR